MWGKKVGVRKGVTGKIGKGFLRNILTKLAGDIIKLIYLYQIIYVNIWTYKISE